MIASPSQRWSSSVHDLFACARGRLPASFLERKLADLGLTGVAPLPFADLQRLEKAVDLVNELCAGRPAPRGLKPDAALLEAFPDSHATLGKLRQLAQDYIASMRPAKPGKGRPADATPAPAPERRDERRDDRRPERRDDRRERPAPRPEQAPPPRAARVTWEQWLEGIFPAKPAPAPAVEPAAPAATPADAAPATPGDATAAAPAAEAPAATPAAAPAAAPALPAFVPPALVHWQIDGEAKRQLGRIRERANEAVAAKAEPAAALRELAFAILRPPMAVRDDLRALLADYLQRNGVSVTLAALYPPPAVAAMKRDWENLLAQRGPNDPAVEAAWRKLLEAHPEAKAKLEAERAHELDDLVRRFAVAVREIGEEDPRTREIRAWMESHFANAGERIAAELAAIHAAIAAAATAGRLVNERNWEDAEVIAALAALDPAARARLEAQRRKELDELDRRLRTTSREKGLDDEATRAALAQLCARFPSEGAAATTRLDRIRRGEGLVQQERERREAGKPLSGVHTSPAEHRLTRLAAAPRWRLVIAVSGPRQNQQPAKDGKENPGREPRARRGHAIGWLIGDPGEAGPVAAGWRAADCGSLDELDAAVQAVVDRAGGIVGLPLADCPEHGDGMWADAAYALATLAALVVPVDGTTEIAVELPAWAEVADQAALDAALKVLGTVTGRTIARTAPAADHAASLADALVWSWDGRKEADAVRVRQAALASGCLLQPSAALREALAQLATGALPTWPTWSTLLADAAQDPDGIAAALLARIRAMVAASSEAVVGLHRHLTGLARGRIADPARLVRELAWLDGLSAGLRPRDRLRLDLAVVAAQAAAGRIEPAAAERLTAKLADLRDDWPAEVLEVALHAAGYAREALDPEAAEAFVAPWGRGDAAACGGRALLAKLCEERARIAASAGRWKDARKHLERGSEVAARCADHADRDAILARLAVLRAAVLSDDTTVSDEEARAALIAVLSSAEPIAAAVRLAVEGTPRSAHLALLRWAVRRQDEDVISAYLGKRASWCDPREATGAIIALRAVVLAPVDADAARAQLAEAAERAGGDAAPASLRLSLLACTVACALKGAALPDLRERLAALRRERPAATPAVEALERALALAPDVRAGFAEALPLLVR